MGIDVHTIDQLNGSQFNRQDRVLLGMLAGVATPASATSATVLGAITAGTGFSNINTVTLAPTGGTGSGLAAIPTSLKNISDTDRHPWHGLRDQRHHHPRRGHAPAGRPGSGYRAHREQGAACRFVLNSGGSGGANPYVVGDTITLSGGTSTTAAIVTVDAVDGSGLITAFHISTKGVYSVEASTFTQGSTTSSAGTGATFKTAVWGVQAVTVSTAALTPLFPPLRWRKPVRQVQEQVLRLPASGVSALPRSPTAATTPGHRP